MSMHKTVLRLTFAGALLAASAGGHAANWLELQGTEPPGSSPGVHVWGFVQPEYDWIDNATSLQAGPWKGQNATFDLIRPDLKSRSTFFVRRARLGARGMFPHDRSVNYFFLAECGHNGITKYTSGACALTDASVTLNDLGRIGALPLPRIRVGQFKYPGAEEGFQAVQMLNYINYTNVTDQLLFERYVNNDGSDKKDPTGNRLNGSRGAFRDIGVELFNWFDLGPWEHTYAIMVGNGNGINRLDGNGNRELYAYWSSAYIWGGKGLGRQDWKLFAWYETGDRTINADWSNARNVYLEPHHTFRRTRWGLGSTLLKGRWRGAFEYIAARGMIFNGTDGGAVAGALMNGSTTVYAQNDVLPTDSANGWYVDGGYRVLRNTELELRYDRLNRATAIAANERRFDTWTVGMQYFFSPAVRVIFNYAIQSATAPHLADNSAPNTILAGMGNLGAVQVLAVF